MGWMLWNFIEKYDNVIFIASNPHFANVHLQKVFGFNPFYLVIEVWSYGWNDDLKTVPPEEVTKVAVDTLITFPEKKMIIFYMQPHHPFLSDKDLVTRTRTPKNFAPDDMRLGKRITVWDLAVNGAVPLDRVIKGYKENLKIVWNEVEKLKNILKGKIIVTSDHGNLIGEYGMYGHGGPLRAEGLVKVPWVILKDEKKVEGAKLTHKEDINRKTRAQLKDKIKKAHARK